jgi:DNA polymerase-1
LFVGTTTSTRRGNKILINADVKSLEVVVAAELSDDKVLKDELVRRLDLHDLNQKRFGLPDRVTAKRFIFKLLYGATAYGYTTDSDFIGVSFTQKQWQAVIDEFYAKYTGIARWHAKIEAEAKINGILTIPSGRYFNYIPTKTQYGWKWPTTKIKNYPVQGFGADLVMLARIEAFKQFVQGGYEGCFIQTIHDSLVYDVPAKIVDDIVKMLSESIAKVPELCYTIYKCPFSLPLTSEILVGPNKKDLKPYEISRL